MGLFGRAHASAAVPLLVSLPDYVLMTEVEEHTNERRTLPTTIYQKIIHLTDDF